MFLFQVEHINLVQNTPNKTHTIEYYCIIVMFTVLLYCITFCNIQHSDSVTKPDYFYDYYEH